MPAKTILCLALRDTTRATRNAAYLNHSVSSRDSNRGISPYASLSQARGMCGPAACLAALEAFLAWGPPEPYCTTGHTALIKNGGGALEAACTVISGRKISTAPWLLV